ncbi:MAG: endo-1,4-beta-xylanase, partial [Flavisolibacter sp.]
MKYSLSITFALLFLTVLASCKKDPVRSSTPPPPPPPVDTPTTLKAAASFPIGFAINYGLFKNNASYRTVVTREADQVTFGYEMKHGAIVKDDGSFDYSIADELLNLATAAGLQVYGHTLVWHS